MRALKASVERIVIDDGILNVATFHNRQNVFCCNDDFGGREDGLAQ